MNIKTTAIFIALILFSLSIQASEGGGGEAEAAPGVAAIADTRGWIGPGTPGYDILKDYAELNTNCKYPAPLLGEKTEWPEGFETGVDPSGRRFAFTAPGGDHIAALDAFLGTPGKRECASTAKAVAARHMARVVGEENFPKLLALTPETMSSSARSRVVQTVSLGLRAGPLEGKFYPHHWLYKQYGGDDCTPARLPGLVSPGSVLCLVGHPQHDGAHPYDHMAAMNMVCVGFIPEGQEHAEEPVFCRFRPGHPTRPERLCEVALDLVQAFARPQSEAETAFLMRAFASGQRPVAAFVAAEAARKDVCARLAPLEGELLLREALAMCCVHAVEVPNEAILGRFREAVAVVGADEEEGAGAGPRAGGGGGKKAKKGKKHKKRN